MNCLYSLCGDYEVYLSLRGAMGCLWVRSPVRTLWDKDKSLLSWSRLCVNSVESLYNHCGRFL